MNDIDLLMSRVDEINLKGVDELTADDIDTLIAYHRQMRGRKASGEKPKKPTINLSEILNIKPKSTTPTGTVRRI